jgi:hypothetical protein
VNAGYLLLPMLLCSCAMSWSRSWSSVSVTAATPMALPSFEFTDPAAFRIAEDEGLPCLELYRDADYSPPHRSPKAMAIVVGDGVDDFVLEVEAKQTGREYPHRDLVFVFGWRDAAHFCYAHLASGADASAHHVQLVDGADRMAPTGGRSRPGGQVALPGAMAGTGSGSSGSPPASASTSTGRSCCAEKCRLRVVASAWARSTTRAGSAI